MFPLLSEDINGLIIVKVNDAVVGLVLDTLGRPAAYTRIIGIHLQR